MKLTTNFPKFSFRPKFKLGAIFFRNTIFAILILVLGFVMGMKYKENRIPFFNANTKQIQFRLTNAQAPEDLGEINFQQFWEVWEILGQDYIDQEKLDQEKMVDGAIAGMTAALGDPYTMYLPPEEDKRAAESLAGSFFGVGIELGYIDKIVSVVAPLKGMPADLAGVKAGDMILHIKDEAKDLDEDTVGWSLHEAVNKIRGEKGAEVTLTFLRPDESREPFEIVLKRDQILIPSVELSFVEHQGKKVGLVELSRFGERTDDEWDGIVDEILAQKGSLNGVLLDMRNNPGGFFDGAIDIASDFIEDGIVVSQQGKFNKQPFAAKGKARLKGIPLMVLVNRGSASASEIVAGALRDDLGVKLVGENTFGKGTVQDRRSLSNGGGLHVTVAKWMLPGGDWIHEDGIPVDVEVKDDAATEEDEVVLKAIEEI